MRGGRKKSYYGTKKVKYNNLIFDSSLELYFYKLLESNNLLEGTILQYSFELQPAFSYNGSKIRKIDYVSDFYLKDLNIVVETKGLLEEKAKIKHKIFKFKYPENYFFMPRNQGECRDVLETILKIKNNELLREEGHLQQQPISDKPRARRKSKSLQNVPRRNTRKNSTISKS
jgi:hypothetical protein